jgi:hypothetical protein
MIEYDVTVDDRKGLPSASGMERIMLCPGSWQLESSMEEVDVPSRAALEGSMLHEVLAGNRPAEGLTERQLWIVQRCRELLAVLQSQLGFAEDYPGSRTLVEERLWFYDEEYRPIYSGQMDYAIVDGTRGLLVDYKTGGAPVTPSGENYQMRSQAVLLAHNFELEEVYVAILQPLAADPIAVARYGPDDLRLAEIDVLAGLDAAIQLNPVRIPGERQCRYCRAKPLCPEVRSQALSLVPPQSIVVDRPSGKLVVPTLTGEQLSELLPKLEIAEKVIREIKRQAKDLLEEQPDAIEGYQLKQGAERRTIANAQEAYARLSSLLTPEQFAACCSVQIGKLEELLREALGESMRGARQQLDELLGDVVERKPSERSLDRRGAE